MFSFVKAKRTPQIAWLQGMALSEETLERVVGGVGAESGEEADGPTAAEQVQEQLESAADTQSPAGGVSTSQEEEAQKLLKQMEELAQQSGDDMSADGGMPSNDDTPAEDGGDFANASQEMPDDPAPDQESAEISAGESEGNRYSDIQSVLDECSRIPNMIREGDGRFSDPDTSQEQSQNADNNLNEFRAEIANAAKNGGVSLSTLSTDKGIENTTAGQPNGPALRIGESHAGQPEGNPVSQVPPENAQEAIDRVRAAQEQVSNERVKLGETQNRLEHTINNLKGSSENLSAAESRIRDVDMAKEMTHYSKNNILQQQASSAMLAQAASGQENQDLDYIMNYFS